MLQGFDGAETFIVLEYGAANLVPGTTSLQNVTFEPAVSTLARSNTPQMRMLTLALKRRCPVWRPGTGPMTPKPGYEEQFQRLAALAQATQLYIVFDYAHLRRESQPIFDRFTTSPEELSSFDVARYYTQHHFQRDDTLFDRVPAPAPASAAAALDSGSTTEDEDEADAGADEPPPYIAARGKRHASTSAPSSPPARKRTGALSSTTSHAPRTEQDKTGTGPAVDVLGYGLPYGSTPIDAAMHDAALRVLPSILITVLPGMIQTAVVNALPAALDKALPPYLSVPMSPSSSSSQSVSSQSTRADTPPPRTVIDTILTRRVLPDLVRKLQRMHDRTLEHAAEKRDEGDTALLEELGNLRYDLQQVRTDCEVELNDICQEKLDSFKVSCAAEVDESAQRAAQQIDDVHDLAGGRAARTIEEHGELLTSTRDLLERVDKLVTRSLTLLEGGIKSLERREGGAGTSEVTGRGMRARSAPL
ncbi:hypothetical protein FB567DRAFT_599646 [Paraphoma chrysanthemicola]|uniref:Uncharacterized protein n=1 Tax=Paraphoma chrysanthemicola TaxID=798071 RepID=A0A8K0QR97_9PLEO|nr:hypothetical protein FB567DRAFT_599646 [Paraphoma chrysanthemicola]